MIKTYSELITINSYIERFRYLKLDGVVGEETFGRYRQLNQILYHSGDWLSFKDKIIIRDGGQDLGMEGFDIYGPIYVHHINPITIDDILSKSPCIFDPENVICAKYSTHNAIHYGDETQLGVCLVQRFRNDTCPWKKS